MANNEEKQEFVIDASEALSTLGKLQDEFLKYNQSLGTIIAEQSRVNFSSQEIITKFTQIDQAGRKVISTVQGNAQAFRILSAEIKKASDAERDYAAQINKTTEANKRLADSLKNVDNAQKAIGGRPLRQLSFNPASAIPLGPPIGGAPGGPPPFATSFPGGGEFPFGRGLSAVPVAAFEAFSRQLTQIHTGLKLGAELLTRFNAAGNTLAGTFGLIGKAAAFSVIYHTIYASIHAMEEGIHTASEFYRQIGLVQTLVDQGINTFDNWSTAVRKLAEEFHKPAVEVAQATYEALSNQVIQTTKDFEFLRRALEFSRVINASSTDAINLFSSAVNSFDLTVEDSERIARTFFTTIDIGRVKVSDLADTLGRVGPIAHLMGLSLEDVGASISALTLVGTLPRDALTLLANVLKTMAKPGEELAKLFHQAGYESGQAAVEALGFVGVLELIREQTHGSITEFAKLFPEMRGFRAANILAGEGLDVFKRALEEAGNQSDRYKDKVAILNKNIGQRFQDQLRDIANFFTIDIGGKLVSNLEAAIERFGGLVNIVKTFAAGALNAGLALGSLFAAAKVYAFSVAIQDSVKAVKDLEGAIVAARAAMTALGGASALTGGLITAGLAAAAFTIGYIVLHWNDSIRELERTYSETFKNLQGVTDELADRWHQNADRMRTDLEHSLQNSSQTFYRFGAGVQKILDDIMTKSLEVGKRITENLKDSFENVGTILRKNISDLESKRDKATNTIADIKRALIENQRSAERGLFEHQLDTLRDNLHKFPSSGNADAIGNLVGSRSDQLRRQGRQLFAVGDIVEGRRSFEEARRVLNDLNQGRQYTYHTENLIKAIYTEENALLAAQEPIQQKIIKSTTEQLDAERTRYKHIQDIFERIAAFKVVDKEGKLLPEFKKPEDAVQALHDLQAEAIEAVGTINAAANPNIFADFANQIERVKAALSDQFANTFIQANTLERGNIITKLTDQVKELGQEHTTVSNNIQEELKKTQTDYAKTTQEAKALFDTFKKAEEKAQRGNVLFADSSVFGGSGGDFTNKRLARISELISRDTIKPENFQEIFKLLEEEKKAEQNGGFAQSIIGAKGSVDQTTGAVRTLGETIDLLVQKFLQLKGDQNNQVDLQNKLKQSYDGVNSKIRELNDSMHQLVPNSNEAYSALSNIGNSAGALDKAATAADNLQKKLKEVSRTNQEMMQAFGQGGNNGEGKYWGGPIYKATGGPIPGFFNGAFARGSDIIPVMASPGEFMIRNPYSQQFRPLLEAINSGRGQRVLNNNKSIAFGNINVTLQGSQSTQTDIVTIAQGVQRAVRSGLARLQ